VRIILQSESSECGLACLAMIASAYGHQVDLVNLRHRFPLSLKGIRLPQLVHIAKLMHFQSRPLRLDINHISKLITPCILHWNMNHFVVLKYASRDKVVILDPAVGERKISFDELSKHFTGVAIELTPTTEFQAKNTRDKITIRQLTGKINGLPKLIAQIFMLSIALQFFLIVAPLYMQWVVDQVLVSMDKDLLFVLFLGFCLALAIQIGIGILRGWMVIYISSRLGLHWTGNVFFHLMRLPLDFFEKRNLGDITSRLGSIQSIQHTLTHSFIETIIDGIMVAATFALMLAYSWKLAFITLFAMTLYVIVRYISYRPFRDYSERQLTAAARRQTHLLESLRGIQSIKIAGHESFRQSVYSNLMVDVINNDVRISRMSLIFLNAQQLIFGVEKVIVIFVGATFALQNSFSVGMLVAYLVYKEQFSARAGGLVDKWVDLKMLRLHGERLGDILLTPAERDEASQAMVFSGEDSIVVENLSFRHAEGEPWIIKNCTFFVSSGESVAITGSSGCGKTTLIKLLLGLLKPTEGIIRIAGLDVNMAGGVRSIRDMIGVVMQDDQLFTGSIAENISFFSQDFDPEKVEMAAKIASVHDDIMAMPMGYHSMIGDMGSSLSGGQKQRIILARAIYRKPRFLFLDEATSHLDVAKERLINDAVNSLRVTKVIMAHRHDTIANADRVFLMKEGRVVVVSDLRE